MPTFNPTTGALSTLRRDWYDQTRMAQQDCATGVCKAVLSDGTILQDPAAINAAEMCAGGEVAAWLREQDATVYDTIGRSFPGATVQLRGAGPDGAYARKVSRNSYGPWQIVEVDHCWDLTGGDAHDIQVLGNGQVIWMIGDTDYQTPATLALDRPAERHYGRRACWVPDWSRWINCFQRASDGALVVDNHVVAPASPSYFYPDIEFRDGKVRITWSPSQADDNPQLLELTLDQLQALPISVGPLTLPTFTFTHPVIVAPFAAQGSGLPELSSLQADGRHFEIHDGTDDWTPPASLRPFDAVLLEQYRVPEETLDQSVARWTRQMSTLLTQWAGDCGAIGMWYDQLRWTEQQILDGLAHCSAIVNLSPRIKIVAPFAYNRANGIIKYPSLQTSLDRLVAERDRVGLAHLTPIPPPQEDSAMAAAATVQGVIHYTSKKASSRSGCTNYTLPNGRVFSCQSNGDAGDRDPGTDGPWEQGQEAGAIATFNSAGTLYTWLVAPVNAVV